MPLEADEEALKVAVLAGLTPRHVLLVLTPGCDLQRGEAPRVLLLLGEPSDLKAKDWSYGGDMRTPAIRLDNELAWIKWDLKHIATATVEALNEALDGGRVRIVGRLRDSHALEVQQRVLSGLGRVAVLAALPATFPVELEAFYAGADGRPSRLDVPELNDGAVCWVGRDAAGAQIIRLVTTEVATDGIITALSALKREQVAEAAHTAFGHVTSTTDLRRLLMAGYDLKGVNATGWQLIKSDPPSKDAPNMGLIAWNYEIPDGPLDRKQLNKAGVILLVRDVATDGAPGLGAAIRSGLVSSEGVDADVADTGGEDAETAAAKAPAAPELPQAG